MSLPDKTVNKSPSPKELLTRLGLGLVSIALLAGCVDPPQATYKEPVPQVQTIPDLNQDLNLSPAIVERSVAEGVPPPVIAFIKEIEGQGRIPAFHGTCGWCLVSGKVLSELGYDQEIVETYSTIKSFETVASRFPGGIVNRHNFKIPNYINPRNQNWNKLWVATERPGVDVPDGTSWLVARDYANGLMRRVFSPKVAAQVTENTQRELARLTPLVESGQATTEQIVLYENLSWQFGFNTQRMELITRIGNFYLKDQAKAYYGLMKTPIGLLVDADPSNLSYSNNVEAIVGTINTGEISPSSIRGILYPKDINPNELAILKNLYPEIPFIEDASLVTQNTFTRMNQSTYNALWQVGRLGESVVNNIPLLTLIGMTATPLGIASVDLVDTTDAWQEQIDEGRTNMSLSEYIGYRNEFLLKLSQIGDPVKQEELFWPMLEYLEANKIPNPWSGSNLNVGSSIPLELIIPVGVAFTDILNVNDNFILGKSIAASTATVIENLNLGSYYFTYSGLDSEGKSIIHVTDSSGNPVEIRYEEGLGQYIGFPLGTISEFGQSQGAEVEGVFLIRYVDLEQNPGQVRIVLKPEVVDRSEN